MIASIGTSGTPGLPSDSCEIEELWVPYLITEGPRQPLRLGPGWTRRWTTSWKLTGAAAVCPVRDLASVPLASAEPVRRFGWHCKQRHRPGLQFLVSTDRHHGFESLAEQHLLLALDFAGDLVEVRSQPFRLRYATTTGWREHVPDFLAVTRTGVWLLDVRPQARIGAEDQVAFAAADEVALATGWRYGVVAGWREHVLEVLDALSAQRRPLTDQLGLQAELLSRLAAGPCRLGELVEGTSLPVVARAHLLHLLWHRRLGVELAQPLTDHSPIWSPPVPGPAK